MICIPLQGIPNGGIINTVPIQSFNDAVAEKFFMDEALTGKVGWSNIKKVAKRKLDMLDYAERLDDLKSPPGNRLEALKGKLDGFHSIRINDQWRIIFRWTPLGPSDVKIDDYH